MKSLNKCWPVEPSNPSLARPPVPLFISCSLHSIVRHHHHMRFPRSLCFGNGKLLMLLFLLERGLPMLQVSHKNPPKGDILLHRVSFLPMLRIIFRIFPISYCGKKLQFWQVTALSLIHYSKELQPSLLHKKRWKDMKASSSILLYSILFELGLGSLTFRHTLNHKSLLQQRPDNRVGLQMFITYQMVCLAASNTRE